MKNKQTNIKVKSTYDELVEKLSPKEKQEFDEEFKELVLSELVLALTQDKDLKDIRIKTLAKIIGVSEFEIMMAAHNLAEKGV